jgi:hypothetical protein
MPVLNSCLTWLQGFWGRLVCVTKAMFRHHPFISSSCAGAYKYLFYSIQQPSPWINFPPPRSTGTRRSSAPRRASDGAVAPNQAVCTYISTSISESRACTSISSSFEVRPPFLSHVVIQTESLIWKTEGTFWSAIRWRRFPNAFRPSAIENCLWQNWDGAVSCCFQKVWVTELRYCSIHQCWSPQKSGFDALYGLYWTFCSVCEFTLKNGSKGVTWSTHSDCRCLMSNMPKVASHPQHL